MRSDGRPECQVLGCQEAARPWALIYDFDGLDVEVLACPRHERELSGSGLPRKPEPEAAPSS